MKITATRIKEIIREEYRRMNEASRYEEADIITVPGVGPQGLRRSLDSGGGMQLADDKVRAAFAKALNVDVKEPFAVYAMGPGAGFQALVEFDDGRLVKVKLGGGFTGDSGSEDVDAAINLRRGLDRPMGVKLEEERTGVATGKMSDLRRMVDNPELRDKTAAQLTGQGDEDQSELQKKAMQIFRNLSGVQQNERDIVELLLNIIELAKSENINQQELRRRLRLAKDAAAQIAK